MNHTEAALTEELSKYGTVLVCKEITAEVLQIVLMNFECKIKDTLDITDIIKYRYPNHRKASVFVSNHNMLILTLRIAAI
jgi:hypothetical protein